MNDPVDTVPNKPVLLEPKMILPDEDSEEEEVEAQAHQDLGGDTFTIGQDEVDIECRRTAPAAPTSTDLNVPNSSITCVLTV